MLEQGQTIVSGKYELLRRLGSGSFGEVWLALEVNSNTQVAIKVGRATDEQIQERSQREMRISRPLDHPHLLRAETVEQEGENLYLVFPYAAGGSLRQRLDEQPGRRLPVEEAVQIAVAVAEGLGYLHEQDLVHRDVHPGNILFTGDGVAKLCDFGLVQSPAFSDELWYGRRVGDRHPGNVHYQPPEAWAEEGKPLKPLPISGDVYMLGAVLWEMLTGRLYYNHSGKSASELRPEVPKWLDQLAQRCLADDPAARPVDGAELARLLRQGEEAGKKEAAGSVGLAQLVPGLLGVVGLAAVALVVLGTVTVLVITGVLGGPRSTSMTTPTVAALPTQMPEETPIATPPAPTPIPPDTMLPTAADTPLGPTLMPKDTPIPPTQTPEPTNTATPPTTTPLPTNTPVPAAPVPAPAAGDVFIRPADEMEMVYVPEGEFIMGSTLVEVENTLQSCTERAVGPDCDRAWFEWEQPQHTVYLDSFWIDRHEVTNEQFSHFVDATGYRTDAEREEGTSWVFTDGEWQVIEDVDWLHPWSPDANLLDQMDHPVIQMSWNDAQAYCAWAGGRLPTEAEWEKAARGTDAPQYPWGYTFDGSRLNFCDRNCEMDWKDPDADDGYGRTAPVGSYPAGASPYGALDMAGNVWEWVADRYDEDYYSHSPNTNPPGPDSGEGRAVRGGSWFSLQYWARSAIRFRNFPDFATSYIVGFRCVVSSTSSL